MFSHHKTKALSQGRWREGSDGYLFNLISKFKERRGVMFHGFVLNIGEGEQAVQVRFHDRAVTPAMLEQVISSPPASLN